MGNIEHIKPYQSSQDSKKNQVQKMFDKIAPAYDSLNSILSLGIDNYWRRKAIQLIPISDAQLEILDVACGTGDMSILASKRFPHYQFTGIDLSEGMLEVGKKRILKINADQIKLQWGDCENLPYEPNTFDAIMVAFGVRNFENLELGIQNMYRVLKENGKIIILEFSKPRVFPFKQIYTAYFRYVLPWIGRIGSKDDKAYKYLYDSVQQFPDYERFVGILEKSGFHHCNYKPLSLGICSIYTGIKS